MTNERLGIYDELRANARQYGQAEMVRRRLAQPIRATSGAYAQPLNPFAANCGRAIRARMKLVLVPRLHAGGFNKDRQRTVWPEAKFGISLDTVIVAVVEESGIRGDEMFSIHQMRRIVRPRQVAMYMIDRYCPDYSFPQIGYLFRKDHTTIMHAIEAVYVRLLDKHDDTVNLVAGVHKRLHAIAQAA